MGRSSALTSYHAVFTIVLHYYTAVLLGYYITMLGYFYIAILPRVLQLGPWTCGVWVLCQAGDAKTVTVLKDRSESCDLDWLV